MIKCFPLVKAGSYLCFRWLLKRIVGCKWIPESGSVIIASNHSSLLDGALLTAMLNMQRLSPCHVIVQQESFKEDFFGYILRCGKCIPVDRQSRGSIASMFGLALAYLQKGERVLIFPEGHLNNGESLRLPRPGAALLALESGAPILPVGLRGTRNILPFAGKFNLFARAEIHYGKLIDTTALSREYQTADKARRSELVASLSYLMMAQLGELSGMSLHRRMQKP